MMASWMLYASLVGLLAGLAAHALDHAARANRLPSRFIWLAAMVTTVLAPVVGYAVRRASPIAPAARGTVGVATSLGLVPQERPTNTSLSGTIASLRAAAVRLDRPVAYAWALCTLLLFGRLAFATGMVWRDRRAWTLREIDGVPLWITPDLGPAVVALPRSEILLPQWLLSLNEGHVAMVVRHEREHRAAGDPRLLVAATVFTALVPWNPALWWQRRRLRLAVEMDCDARVLRADPRVDRYGSLLLAIAQHPRATLYEAATLTESRSDLERRINAMTSKPSAAPRVTAAVLAGIAAAALFAACVTPSPDLIVAPSRNQAKTAPGSVLEFAVERPVKQIRNALPRFPEQLRRAGVGGVVVAKFVVDTNGHADMRTFLVVKSDHDLFSGAVREALPKWQFEPAQIGGRPVKQLMQMPFVFALSSEELDSLDALAHTSVPDTRPQKPIPPGAHGLVKFETATSFAAAVRPADDTIPPHAKADNRPPEYPVQLRMANIEGQVVARFIVLADGSVDTATFKIVNSSHDLFSNAVRSQVKTFHFLPATINGTPVDWLVTMPFSFSLSK